MKINFQDWCVLIAGVCFPIAVLALAAGFFTGTYDRHPALLLRGVIVGLFTLPFFIKGLRKFATLRIAKKSLESFEDLVKHAEPDDTTTPAVHS